MTQFEVVHPGLEFAAGVVCDEARAVREHLSALPDIFWPSMKHYEGFSILANTDIVLAEEPPVALLQPLTAALTDLASRPVFESRHRATLNRYDPGAQGVFHTDHVFDFPVFVAGISDLEGESFDYVDSDETGEVQSIDFNAGDVLKITNASLFHRGKNPSSHYRYSVVLFNRYGDLE